MIKIKWPVIFVLILCMIALVQLAAADDVDHDTLPPAPTDPPVSPYTIPIMVGLDLGPSQIPWTDTQRQAVQWAINQLSQYFTNNPAFTEGLSGITLQWAGDDFFRDWSGVEGFDPQSMSDLYGWDPNINNWDNTPNNAFANAPWFSPSRPWGDTYPMNEVIFNVQPQYGATNWHFDPYTFPEPNEKDFGSSVLHELLHMLGIKGHSSDPDSAIYKKTGSQLGQRKSLTTGDVQSLKDLGYPVSDPRVPEPATIVSFLLGAAGFAVRRLVKRRA